MQVYTNNNLNFTSRNATIRFADDIARRVNHLYPRVSSTKYEGLKSSRQFVHNIVMLFSRITHMRRDVIYSNTRLISDIVDRWRSFANIIKFYRLGNCQESAMLGEIAAKVNGIKNCRLMEVRPKGAQVPAETFDHAVLYVDGEKPYIIDPWLGFADYVPETIKRFQKEYRHHFDFEKFHTEDFQFDFLGKNHILDSEEIAKLRKSFPEMIINKN